MKQNADSSQTIAWARRYCSRGWSVIPIPCGEKRPRIEGWPELRLAETDLAKYFSQASNIGVLLGDTSGRLIDIDIDCTQALELAAEFLPPTDLCFGRRSKPQSHWLYNVDNVPKYRKFSDPDGSTLVEIRSNRHQTIVPPSLHPSGETVEWLKMGEAVEITSASLEQCVMRFAACALTARRWPATGSRHDFALALAGFLSRGDYDAEWIEKFVQTAARAAQDDEWRERGRDASDTVKAFAANAPTTGKPTLENLLGPDGKKVVERLTAWLHISSRKSERNAPLSYLVENGVIVRSKQTDAGPISQPLCNFTAQIESEVVRDDGVEAIRALVISGKSRTGIPFKTITVPSSNFASLSWVTANWGARAIVRAGPAIKDQLREAIQTLSPEPSEKWIYAHTGWRKIDGQWFYLTSSGAAGREMNIEVDLGHDLAGYCLPQTLEDPVGAMRSSINLLSIAPLPVTAPLWAAMFRSTLASFLPLDFSIWLEGPTGSLKSSLAALFLSHFGVFGRTALPASWNSTGNFLERRAAILKDAPLVIDDYAPSGFDLRDLDLKAGRLLRSQGNLSSRGRLRADLSQRPATPPRGLIVGTGEQHPTGQSILARLVLVEVDRKAIDLGRFSEAQRKAGILAHAMTGFLNWIAPQLPQVSTQLRDTFEAARNQLNNSAGHMRIPELLAQLWVGLHVALTYAEELGARSTQEVQTLKEQCWKTFLELGTVQNKLVEGERPSLRFLQSLFTLLNQGRVTLLPKTKGTGTYDGALSLGWLDSNFIYLEAGAAYKAVAVHCKDSGEPFATSLDRLKRDLKNEGISEVEPGRFDKSVNIGGKSKRVLKLNISAVEQLTGQDMPAVDSKDHQNHRSSEEDTDGL